MAKLLGTSRFTSYGTVKTIDDLVQTISFQRKSFERKWYDNNFFDDGYHFRYVSRTTGKVMDINNPQSNDDPKRAIPKASKQIRGIANLLMQPSYVPQIYPEKVIKEQFTDEQQYKQALEISQTSAKRQGNWVQKEWQNQDIQQKLTQMLTLTAKNCISYIQIWPDAVEEKICTQVYDAFDIYIVPTVTSIYDSPILVKTMPVFIAELKANENYDQAQLEKISPDNKYASSEIKEAYMITRYGSKFASEKNASLMLKEAYIKEYLDDDNIAEIKKQKDADLILANKKKGDTIIRQIHCAGGVWLRDVYTNLSEYPFVDFRFEPGTLYQTALIERFIPTNKSLDNLISRLEKYSNTMVTGVWQKRKGESFEITNSSGAQVINYEVTPPIQGQISPIPAFYFNLIGLLNSFIEEQGVSTSALGKVPSGVKAGVAIESLKESEFASLKIAADQLKWTIKKITEKMLDIASDYFINPQEAQILNEGNPDYYDIIGQRGYELRQQLGMPTANIVPIKKGNHVDINVESGMGYTMQGKREIVGQFMDKMITIAQAGYLPPEAVKQIIFKYMETYQFGPTQEFVSAMEDMGGMDDQTIEKMKLALAETMQDLDMAGAKADEKMIDTTKLGVAEAMKDLGLINKPDKPIEIKEPSQSISFKDLPDSGKVQLAAKAGIQLNPLEIKIEKQEVQNAITQKKPRNDG